MALSSKLRGRSPVLDPELRGLATVVVLGSFMSILDTTIVAVSLDVLGKDFAVPISTIQWVSTGYLLALGVVIPVTGWAIDRFGAKRMWMISLALFVGGSALCGLANSAPELIAFRVLQGLGGGMVLPIGQSILARAAGPQRMGRVMSVVGVPTVMGPVLGPVLGGLIVSNTTWRWIFYVNVPIGIVALALSFRVLKGRDGDPVEHPFDLLGFLLLSPGLALLIYALSEVGSTGSLTNAQVLIGCSLGILLMAGFVWHGLKAGSRALLDLTQFRYRSFTVANVSIFLFGATLFGSMLVLPLYYQVVRGQSALAAGLLMAPQGIGAALVMRSAGAMTDRMGPRRIVPFGVTLMVLGSIPFAFVGVSTNEALLGFSLLVRGVGLGLTMMPVISAGYYELTPQAVPRATTTINIMRQVGGSVATALFAVVLERQLVSQAPALASHQSTGFSLAATARIPPPLLPHVAQAFANTFWLAVATTALTIIPVMFLPDRMPSQDAQTAVSSPATAEQPS